MKIELKNLKIFEDDKKVIFLMYLLCAPAFQPATKGRFLKCFYAVHKFASGLKLFCNIIA